MLKVGITGGIGSGKTTVCQLFQYLGIPVYNADERAKWLMTNNPAIVNQITELFGKEAYHNNSLNRKHIASKVFKDKNLLAKLNGIVHPAVAIDSISWFNEQNNKPYAVKEAALLIESESYLDLDKLIVVVADKDIRIKRIIERDDTAKENVLKRMENQLPQKDKVELADFIIDNNGNQLLIPQVIDLHNQLIHLSDNRAD